MNTTEFTPQEVAALDQEIAKGDELLDLLVRAYRSCMSHEGGGDHHALVETMAEVGQWSPIQLAALLSMAVRGRAHA